MELSKQEFFLLHRYIQDSCGITISEEKTYLIQQRLEPLVAAVGCKGFSDFYQKLKQSPLPKLREQIINAITTNETSFFRDEHPYIAVEKYILPRLGKIVLERKLRNNLRKGPKVSLWSAGASTGQEPYSLAMLIHEYAEANRNFGISKEDFGIMATDISSETLSKAMAGVYTEREVNRGLTPERIKAYFKKDDKHWIVKSSIRSMVEFRQINLAQPFSILGGFDVVLCRNVLIYFDNDIKKRMIGQFYDMVPEGGFLLLGASEQLYGVTDKFEPFHVGKTLIYKKPFKVEAITRRRGAKIISSATPHP